MQVTFDRLDIVFTIPTRTVDVLLRLLWRGGRQGGDHKAGVVVRSHHFGFQDDPPWLGPRCRRIGKLGVQTAAVGRAGMIGLREGDPLLVQLACLLEDGLGVAEQDRIACQAEDEIDQMPMREYLDHLWGGEMAVAAHEDVGLRPMAT